ncbi:hypothetical protein ACS0TY_025133 [Phlomoides rotata]
MTTPATPLSFATLLHMVTIKLSSTNYLLWKTQLVSILDCQNFTSFVDGSKPAPSPLVRDAAGKDIPKA